MGNSIDDKDVATLSGAQADKSWEHGDGNKTFHHTPRSASAPTQRSGEVAKIQKSLEWIVKFSIPNEPWHTTEGPLLALKECHKHAEVALAALAHLEGSVPSRSSSAVEAAAACQQAFMQNPRNPATWSPRVAAIIQQAMDGARAAAIEEAARQVWLNPNDKPIYSDENGWDRFNRAKDIRALAEQPKGASTTE